MLIHNFWFRISIVLEVHGYRARRERRCAWLGSGCAPLVMLSGVHCLLVCCTSGRIRVTIELSPRPHNMRSEVRCLCSSRTAKTVVILIGFWSFAKVVNYQDMERFSCNLYGPYHFDVIFANYTVNALVVLHFVWWQIWCNIVHQFVSKICEPRRCVWFCEIK